MDYIYLFDTTLRDGLQSANQKDPTILMKQQYLDEVQKYNFDYTEIGMLDSLNHNELPLNNVNNMIFLALPRMVNIQKAIDNNITSLNFLIKSDPDMIEKVLRKNKEEYLNTCIDVILLSIKNNIHTICIMEHFFDSFKKNQSFVLDMIKKIYDTNIISITLADTNGGTMPHEIESILDIVSNVIPLHKLGIHAHNDMEMAVANSIAAVRKGVRLVQGTWNGMGERCGNMNLVSTFCSLILKMNYKCCLNNMMHTITNSSNIINNIFKINNNNLPYVGTDAFSHKGGLHINALTYYEHINPQLVGNKSNIILSDMIGTTALVSILGERPPQDFLPIAKSIIVNNMDIYNELKSQYNLFLKNSNQ